MSALAVSLNTSLATVGISAANAEQLAVTRDTLDTATKQQQNNNAESAPTQISSRGRELSAADQRRVAELARIDAEVRAHEQAHISAGRGVVTSGPTYTYTYGPDGKQYAVGGEVGIDTSPEQKPEANIDKGQRIQDAALAPTQPSPQDYQVAAVGSQLEAQGRQDLSLAQRMEQQAAAEAAAEARKAETKNAQQPPAAEATSITSRIDVFA